jgi:hypothetical protein
MLIFNTVGLGFAALGVGTGLLLRWAAAWIWGPSRLLDIMAVVIASALAIAVDVRYRASSHRDDALKMLFDPLTGGHVCFLPVWLLGLGAIAVTVNDLLR